VAKCLIRLSASLAYQVRYIHSTCQPSTDTRMQTEIKDQCVDCIIPPISKERRRLVSYICVQSVDLIGSRLLPNAS
jgi:hypothetical protein